MVYRQQVGQSTTDSVNVLLIITRSSSGGWSHKSGQCRFISMAHTHYHNDLSGTSFTDLNKALR